MRRLAAVLAVACAALPAFADPLAHLEDRADPRTQDFFDAEAARAREALDRIPGRTRMLERIRALSSSGVTLSHLALGGPRLFYLREGPADATPVLCVRDGLAGVERVLLDPARYAQGARAASIDWLVPSPDGQHVAFGVSPGGSLDAVLRVIAVDGARVLPFEIDRARFNAELAWHADGRSFYYARLPEVSAGVKRLAGARIYRHVLGRESARDEIVFAAGVGGARDVPEHARPALHLPADSAYAYAVVRNGVQREIAVHVTAQKDLAAARPQWRKLAGVGDGILAIEGWRDELYLLSKRDAPRHRVLRVKGDAPDLRGARIVVPQGDSVIEAMARAKDALYLRTMVGGVDRLERVPIGLLGAKAPEYVRTPFDMAISQLIASPRSDGALLRLQGWIEAPMVAQADRRGDVRRLPLQPNWPIDFSAVDEVRLYAPAPDGTRVPITLVYRKSTQLDAFRPTLLTVHGAYGETMSPVFEAARLAWLERGGVLAIAHVRGGGEYGETWHQAGRGPWKANTVADTLAAAEFLVSYGFTQPRRFALEAGGAGAVAAGMALARRPDLFAAVVLHGPLADLERFEHGVDGPASVPEFGSAATPAGAELLRALSPYRQLRDATAYPAALIALGALDARVDPWHSAKLAARLQAATSSGKPVLLRVDPASGHAAPTRAQRDAELADIYSFLLWQMEEREFQLPAAPPAPEAADEFVGPPEELVGAPEPPKGARPRAP